MNPILKASIAAAMTLGAVSAHAAFAVPSSSSAGDLILFADVVNSNGAVVGSYAGDTGITVLGTQAAIAANQTASMNDGTGNLASLLALDTGTNKLVWSIQGGGQLSGADGELADAGAGQFVTTAANNNTGQMGARPSGVLDTWENLIKTTQTLNTNAGGASSVFGPATASAGVFDSTTISSNPSNWYLTGGATGVSGLGTAWNLYGVTGTANPNTGVSGPVALSLLGTATLTANGVTFAPEATTTVPLPAAIWLLGSGLLGLAGVGRRKAVAPTAV
jgi:hypothetical protein